MTPHHRALADAARSIADELDSAMDTTKINWAMIIEIIMQILPIILSFLTDKKTDA